MHFHFHFQTFKTDLLDFLSDLVPISSLGSLESRIFPGNWIGSVALQHRPVESVLLLQLDLNLGRQHLPRRLKKKMLHVKKSNKWTLSIKFHFIK